MSSMSVARVWQRVSVDAVIPERGAEEIAILAVLGAVHGLDGAIAIAPGDHIAIARAVEVHRAARL